MVRKFEDFLKALPAALPPCRPAALPLPPP
jgi:hypothetical protein